MQMIAQLNRLGGQTACGSQEPFPTEMRAEPGEIFLCHLVQVRAGGIQLPLTLCRMTAPRAASETRC